MFYTHKGTDLLNNLRKALNEAEGKEKKSTMNAYHLYITLIHIGIYNIYYYTHTCTPSTHRCKHKHHPHTHSVTDTSYN